MHPQSVADRVNTHPGTSTTALQGGRAVSVSAAVRLEGTRRQGVWTLGDFRTHPILYSGYGYFTNSGTVPTTLPVPGAISVVVTSDYTQSCNRGLGGTAARLH